MAIQTRTTVVPQHPILRDQKLVLDQVRSRRMSKHSRDDENAFTVKDIGGSKLPMLLNQLLKEQLTDPEGETRHLPALFFSDDTGLGMWSKITHLPMYYQTRDEIELLNTWGEDIVERLVSSAMEKNGLNVVDLGAG